MLNPTTTLLSANLILLIIVLLAIWKRTANGDGQGKVGEVVREEFHRSRQDTAEDSKRLRQEIAEIQKTTTDSVIKAIGETGKMQMENSSERLNTLRETVDSQMKSLLENNERKLDQMRQTVDEKLQSTLEKRLGESFKLVSERLEAVQRGLGDMQNLATGVGDLKRMLTNVKTRGTWGEYQLGAILDQILTNDQFEKNVNVTNSGAIVEYAIRLPGQDDSSNIWLPIDAKFPQEDYNRLLSAAEAADTEAVEESTRALIRNIQSSAKDIEEKYIDPTCTTDFAIMFLPTEGLYSEVLRQPGIVDRLQREHRVVVAGPTTLAALLSSLQMGFRTLAIEKRSSEVWQILSAVKTEFEKFGGMLEKAKKQLNSATETIEHISGTRTNVINRKLRDVEKLTFDESAKVLEIEDIE